MDVTRKKPPFGTTVSRTPVTQHAAQRTPAAPFKPPLRPALQFKPAVAQSKNSHFKTGPVGPPVYKPQPVPKVLQKKANHTSRLQATHPPATSQPSRAGITQQRTHGPAATTGKTLQLHPTQHANARPTAPRTVHTDRSLGRLVHSSTTRPESTPRTVHSPKMPTARGMSPVVQRAAFTRSEMKKAQGVVFASRALKELWATTAKLRGIDWDELDEAQQRYFMLEVINSDLGRTRRPPLKKEGKPKLVDFDYKGDSKKGLDPGGSYYHEVTITYTGSRVGDFALGDADLHSKGSFRPPNTVWHHYHDYDSVHNTGKMFLMSTAEHNVGHHGGVWMYEKAHNVKYGA